MRTVIDDSQRTAELRRFDGAKAQIAMFDLSLRRLALRLSRRGDSEMLYIIGVGCIHIRGPFDWRNASISVLSEPAAVGGVQLSRVVDPTVSFELTCSDVVVLRVSDDMPIRTFDDFLLDGRESVEES